MLYPKSYKLITSDDEDNDPRDPEGYYAQNDIEVYIGRLT